MAFNNRGGSTDLNAFRASDGLEVLHDPVNGFCALLAASNPYYIPIGGAGSSLVPSETALVSVHMKWDAAFAGVITYESSNFPLRRGGAGTGPNDVPSYDATVGNWIQENPTSALIYSAGGVGNSITALTITAGGTNAGGVILHLQNMGSRRGRFKVAITANGNLRVVPWGKFGE